MARTKKQGHPDLREKLAAMVADIPIMEISEGVQEVLHSERSPTADALNFISKKLPIELRDDARYLVEYMGRLGLHRYMPSGEACYLQAVDIHNFTTLFKTYRKSHSLVDTYEIRKRARDKGLSDEECLEAGRFAENFNDVIEAWFNKVLQFCNELCNKNDMTSQSGGSGPPTTTIETPFINAAQEVADLHAELVPAITSEQKDTLIESLKAARYRPPTDLEAFKNQVNKILDANDLRIDTDKGPKRLIVKPNGLSVVGGSSSTTHRITNVEIRGLIHYTKEAQMNRKRRSDSQLNI